MDWITPKVCLAATALLGLGNLAQAQTVSFAGPYAGAFAGYGGGTSSQRDNGFIYTPPVAAAPPAPMGGEGGDGGGLIAADGNYGLHGFVGGGLFGYNYQIERFVVGVEADVAGSTARGSSATCGTPAHQCGTSMGVTADVRGRVGLPYGQFMPFIAGGLAIASISAYDSLFGASGRTGSVGYSIGGGIEYKIAPQVSVRLEYLHADFGSRTLFAIVPGVPERISVTTDVIRAGLSYSFFTAPVAPVVARY